MKDCGPSRVRRHGLTESSIRFQPAVGEGGAMNQVDAVTSPAGLNTIQDTRRFEASQESA